MATTEFNNKNIMTGAKNNNNHLQNITNYSLFLGGTNVTHDVLQAYDPLKTGFARIFMVRQPAFMLKNMSAEMKIFRHIIEYGNTAISGIGNVQVNTTDLNGGYTNKGFQLPMSVSDGTDSINITMYEFSGSPLRKVLHSWINGTIDLMTGLTHYNNVDLEKLQSNQTAEFIYALTDPTGQNVEYACMFANCFPTQIDLDNFNYTAGTHEVLSVSVPFTATKYESIQINNVAQKLINKYRVFTNSLNFNSGVRVGSADEKSATNFGDGAHYDFTDGKIKDNSEGIPGITTDFNAAYEREVYVQAGKYASAEQ